MRLDTKAELAQLGFRVLLVWMEAQALRVLWAIQVLEVLEVFSARLVHLDRREALDSLESRAQGEMSVFLDLKAMLDLKANLDLQGPKEPLAPRERRGKEVPVETLDQWALLALLVREVLLETEDSLELMDYLGLREHKVIVDHQGSRDQRAPMVTPDAQENLAYLELGA